VSYTQTGSLVDLFEPQLARDATREMADAAGVFVTDTARALAPMSTAEFGRAPGTLQRSYRHEEPVPFTDGIDAGWESGVVSYDPVARWVEEGVDAHDVEPKRGLYVTFRTTDGRTVRARVVHQRGYAGQFVVRRSLMLAEVEFENLARPALERWKARAEAAAKR
jgi:hypothetical protein